MIVHRDNLQVFLKALCVRKTDVSLLVSLEKTHHTQIKSRRQHNQTNRASLLFSASQSLLCVSSFSIIYIYSLSLMNTVTPCPQAEC